MTGSVTFTRIKAEYVSAMRSHFLAQLTTRRFLTRFPLLLLGAFVIATALYTYLENDFRLGAFDGMIIGVGVAVALAIILGGNVLLIPRRQGREFDRLIWMQRETHFSWSDLGTHWTSENADTRYPWNEYLGWSEAGGAFIFFLSEQAIQFAPAIAFKPAEADDLRDTLFRAAVRRR